MAIVGKEGREEPLLPSRAVLQKGVNGEFQGIADPAAVLGHQLVVGVDDLLQIQLPLVQIGDGAGVGAAARRALLGVARVEAADDLAQQRRRLTADVALAVHQQLVEKGQRLDLLGNVEIQGVGLEHAQIGAEAAPVGLAPGQLQQLGEAALAGETAHQLHVVAHALHGHGVESLPVGHEGRLLLRAGRCVMALQRHVHALVGHELLEIPQAGVDPHVALPLGIVYGVQFR